MAKTVPMIWLSPDHDKHALGSLVRVPVEEVGATERSGSARAATAAEVDAAKPAAEPAAPSKSTAEHSAS